MSSEYVPEFSRLRRLACVALGHVLVFGRGFLAEDEAIDLKWKACRRCFMWMPEGGVAQVETELEEIRRAARRGGPDV